MGVLLSLCVYVRRSFPCEKQPDSIGYAHTGTCVTPRQLSNSLSPLIKVRVINLLFKFNKKKKGWVFIISSPPKDSHTTFQELKNKRWRAGAASPTDNTFTCTTEGFFLVNFIYNINKSSQVQIRLATFDGGNRTIKL
jgi:hypothetical protein